MPCFPFDVVLVPAVCDVRRGGSIPEMENAIGTLSGIEGSIYLFGGFASLFYTKRPF